MILRFDHAASLIRKRDAAFVELETVTTQSIATTRAAFDHPRISQARNFTTRPREIGPSPAASILLAMATRATLLSNGEVLAADGVGPGGVLASSELYEPTATHVDGSGSIDNQGNEVSFKFRATQADDGSKLGPFTFCDRAAGMCIAKAWIQSLSIPGNTAD
jgi:hypothetical protein